MDTAVLASGTGSNLRAILEAMDAGTCRARVTAVISDRPGATALRLAEQRGIATEVVQPQSYPDRAAWDVALAEAVQSHAPKLVVLAGFMRIVGAPMLQAFQGRMINVHPSLLPAFRGMDAPAQAVAARTRISGCTVHLVDDGVDTGATLAQAAVTVRPDDDAEALHARIQAMEHRLLPAVVDAIAAGDMTVGAQPGYHADLPQTAPELVWPPVL